MVFPALVRVSVVPVSVSDFGGSAGELLSSLSVRRGVGAPWGCGVALCRVCLFLLFLFLFPRLVLYICLIVFVCLSCLLLSFFTF